MLEYKTACQPAGGGLTARYTPQLDLALRCGTRCSPSNRFMDGTMGLSTSSCASMGCRQAQWCIPAGGARLNGLVGAPTADLGAPTPGFALNPLHGRCPEALAIVLHLDVSCWSIRPPVSRREEVERPSMRLELLSCRSTQCSLLRPYHNATNEALQIPWVGVSRRSEPERPS